MDTLQTFYPVAEDLLATPPEDLAPILLKFARNTVQNGMFYPDQANEDGDGAGQIDRPAQLRLVADLFTGLQDLGHIAHRVFLAHDGVAVAFSPHAGLTGVAREGRDDKPAGLH